MIKVIITKNMNDTALNWLAWRKALINGMASIYRRRGDDTGSNNFIRSVPEFRTNVSYYIKSNQPSRSSAASIDTKIRSDIDHVGGGLMNVDDLLCLPNVTIRRCMKEPHAFSLFRIYYYVYMLCCIFIFFST